MLGTKGLGVLVGGVALLLVVNQFLINGVRGALMGGESAAVAGTGIGEGVDALVAQVADATIPRGTPAVEAASGEVIEYGAELGVSFDQAAAGIAILAQYEQDTRADKLEGELLERYIHIGQQTACEYCCGVKTMVFPDGSRACGCAHSAAMRGAAAYLLTNYGDVLTDDEILAEVNRFKATYFPKQTVEKAIAAKAAAGEIDPSYVNQLPSQVGGC